MNFATFTQYSVPSPWKTSQVQNLGKHDLKSSGKKGMTISQYSEEYSQSKIIQNHLGLPINAYVVGNLASAKKHNQNAQKSASGQSFFTAQQQKQLQQQQQIPIEQLIFTRKPSLESPKIIPFAQHGYSLSVRSFD